MKYQQNIVKICETAALNVRCEKVSNTGYRFKDIMQPWVGPTYAERNLSTNVVH